MGHACAKNVYDQLGSKLDCLKARTPNNKAFQGILTELYTPAEAELGEGRQGEPEGAGEGEDRLRGRGGDLRHAREAGEPPRLGEGRRRLAAGLPAGAPAERQLGDGRAGSGAEA